MSKFKIYVFPFVSVIYLVFNLIFTILSCLSGDMLIELQMVSINREMLIKAFFVQSISFLIIYCIYSFFNKFPSKTIQENGYSNLCGYFLIGYQIFYMGLSIYYGVGVVGRSENLEINHYLLILTNIFSVDILFFIIGTQLKSSKLFYINLFIYILATTIRGWMGGVLIAIFIFLCRKGSFLINFKNMFSMLVLLVILVLSSPALVDLKYNIRGGDSVVSDDTSYLDKLNLTSQYIFGRFQHVGHVYLIQKNENIYYQKYETGVIAPFYTEGFIQGIIFKNLGYTENFTFGEYVAKNAFGGTGWNTNTGLAGWYYILHEKFILLIFYWLVLLSFVYFIILKYATKTLFNIISVFLIVYLYHGWFGAFFDLLFFACLYTLINRCRIR